MSMVRRLAWVLPLFVLGCGLTDVGNDPTAVEDKDVANAEGARMQRVTAVNALWSAEGVGALYSGLLSDEFFADTPFPFVNPQELLDRRQSATFEANANGQTSFAGWPATRVEASRAIVRLRAYLPKPTSLVGEMFALRGFATLAMGEQFCPGFALNGVRDGQPIYGPALTTDQALQAALVEFDSALVFGADSARIVNFARVGQARALLALGRFAEAAAATAPVPTDFLLNADFFSATFVDNPVFDATAFLQVSVADHDGTNGLDFVTAADPRVSTAQAGLAGDGVTPMYGAGKYPNADAPIVLVSGVEARLIEAEAALAAGSASWLTLLNDLRATESNPPLAPLVDPGSAGARVDLLFRERAFWLFGTGHRLGDLRRLIARYGRPAATVFPTGPYRLGGGYGTATSIPFPATVEATNPHVTGCASR